MLISNTMHQVINSKTIIEGRCGQSMQQMLNGWNVNVNKTGLMLQLDTQIHDVTCQVDLATKEGQPHKLQIQSTLEKPRNRLSSEMSSKQFKLGLEQCSPKTSFKRYSTSSKK
jgi:hypothetical protein